MEGKKMAKKITPRTPASTTAPTTPAAPAASTAPATSATPAAPAPAAKTINPKDPVELQLFKSQLRNGKFSLFARVLNIADKGLKKLSIVFTIEGKKITAITNDQGDASFPSPLTAPADGKELKVSAHISGIRNFSVMHIIKRVNKTPAQVAKDLANNQRARIFFFVAVGLWLICLLVALIFGPGNPLVDFSQTKLTDQQVFFNNLPGISGTSQEIKLSSADQDLGSWQKPFFLVVIFWTIFTIFYGILAFREEVVEECRSGIGKLVDKYYNTSSAKDPLLERLLAFSGHLTSARRSTTTTGTTEPTTVARPSFWQLFRSDLLSDFLVEVVPGIFRALKR